MGSSLVGPDDLSLGHDVAADRGVHLLPCCSGRQIKKPIESIDAKDIMVRVSARRAGAPITRTAEVISSLYGPMRHRALVGCAFCQFPHRGGML